MTFKREHRYVVLKDRDVACLNAEDLATLTRILDKVEDIRALRGKGSVECVVVEHDWPEYEGVWAAIEQRVSSGEPRPVAFETIDKANGIRGVLHAKFAGISLRTEQTHTMLPLYYLPSNANI
jgi:hypothetical protein